MPFSCRAISHDKLGNHAAAIADLSAALKLDSSNTSAYFNRGTCYDSLGQHDLATADFTRALALDVTPETAASKAGQGVAGADIPALKTHAQVVGPGAIKSGSR